MNPRWRFTGALLVLSLVGILGGACTPRRVQILNIVAERPGGVRLHVETATATSMAALGVEAPVSFRAEVLAVQEDGLLLHVSDGGAASPVLGASPVALMTFDAMDFFTIRLMDETRRPPSPGDRLSRARGWDMNLLRAWARYPGPVEGAALEGLLQAHGVPEVARIEPHPARGALPAAGG